LKNILNYRAREEKFFLDYLPDELFINLTEPQRINFRKLRENHLLIQKAESEIQDLYSEIKEKKERIKKIKYKIEGTTERPGYILKMQSAKTELNKLIINFSFSVSIGFRSHKTKKKTNSTPKLYLRIQRTSREFKNIYIGTEEYAKLILEELTSTSWKTIPVEIVKEEIKLLYGSYVRYFIWKKNWNRFFKEKHSLSSVKDWALDMGKDYLRW
tara:strand:- start:712 stop:1353 length:642 start_codon:yes stop_codon:yes gene_type:complete